MSYTFDEEIYYGHSHDKFFLVNTDGQGVFALIHSIMCEVGIYKTILSDKQYDDIGGGIADHPESIYRHAGIGEDKKLRSTLDEIYNESITYVAKQLTERRVCIVERNFRLYSDD